MTKKLEEEFNLPSMEEALASDEVEKFTEAPKTEIVEIAEVEKAHEERYKKLYKNLEKGNVFTSNDTITWKCRNCGYLHQGTSAPEICPACLHPQAHFQIKENNYFLNINSQLALIVIYRN